jgi:D-alanyl-D-alanine carboxypeptidase
MNVKYVHLNSRFVLALSLFVCLVVAACSSASVAPTQTTPTVEVAAFAGKLRLDDPVGKYQPEVPNGANITIRQLLNMSSGLFNYSEDKRFNQTLDRDPGKCGTPRT